MATTQTDEKNPEAYNPTAEEQKLIDKWKSRFDIAQRWRRPFDDRNVRMWHLYWGYRPHTNYAYQTSLMPPIGFEIVETIKPRMSAATMRTRIFPTRKQDLNSPSLAAWDDLVNYDFKAMGLEDKKTDAIHASLVLGNAYGLLTWNASEQHPTLDILHNALLYVDPNAGPRLKGSDWEILLVYKKKSRIEREERGRGANALYGDTLKYLTDETISDDPRRKYYEIETLKMNQVRQPGTRTSGERGSNSPVQTDATDEKSRVPMVELMMCFDHEEGKLLTFGNKKVLMRNEDSPYLKVNKGRIIFDLPCIKVPWSSQAMSILQPVETTIIEIADGRNQAMDSITYLLDPIIKKKKDARLTNDDIKFAPGAIWELQNANDVVIERGPDISQAWIQKDNLLHNEIQSSLALSEYVRGIPSNGTEPAQKIEMLLMQSNIRFSQFIKQMKEWLTDIANASIEMNRAFLSEAKAYRVMGDDIDFKEFTDEDRDVIVDADVEVEIKQEKSQMEEIREMRDLYDLFVGSDKPNEQDPEDVKRWTARKNELQRMLLEAYGKDKYAKLLKLMETTPEEAAAKAQPELPAPADLPPEMAQPAIPQAVPMLPPEGQPGPIPQGAGPAQPTSGLLASLISRARGASIV